MPASLVLAVLLLGTPTLRAQVSGTVAVSEPPVRILPAQATAAREGPMGPLARNQRPAQRLAGEDAPPTYQIQLEPPGLEQLAGGMQSDETLHERIRQRTLDIDPNERIEFPAEPILSRQRYFGRGGLWAARTMIVEPDYVCYRKLLFQDRNAERYGWDLGFIQPAVSYGLFFWDAFFLPAHLFNDPCRKNDCSRGYCMPGDPVPYLLYPPKLSLTGLVAEAGAIIAVCAIFP
jgi:hypothetical protein